MAKKSIRKKSGPKVSGNKVFPLGVKIISIVYFICAIFSILLGFLLFVGAGFVGTIFPELGSLGAGILIVIGIIVVTLGVLGIFIGRGLWKLQSWAYKTVLVLAFLGLVMAFFGLIKGDFSNLFGLFINGLIVYYLIFNKNVKQAFA